MATNPEKKNPIEVKIEKSYKSGDKEKEAEKRGSFTLPLLTGRANL